MRRLLFLSVLCALVSSCSATNYSVKKESERKVSSISDCDSDQPSEVVYCRKVNTKKEFGFDTLYLLNAISENSQEYTFLTAKNRKIKSIEVEILPAKEKRFTNIVQYSLLSGYYGSPMFLGDSSNDDLKVVWQVYQMCIRDRYCRYKHSCNFIYGY